MDINNVKNHWYADIYEQQENQTYDVELLLSIIGCEPKNILEVCCGGGRILVPLGKAGHNAYGFDMDDEMMAKIPKKTDGLKNIKFYKADAITSDWSKTYDIVVLAGNIMINIVTDMVYKDAQRLFIQKAADCLKVGGYIYLDFNLFLHPEKFFNSTVEWVHFDGTDDNGIYGRYIGLGGAYDTETQMSSGKNRTELTLSNGEKYFFENKSTKHIPSLKNIHDWFYEVGFVVEQEYGDYEKNPISENTCRAIIYARKVK